MLYIIMQGIINIILNMQLEHCCTVLVRCTNNSYDMYSKFISVFLKMKSSGNLQVYCGSVEELANPVYLLILYNLGMDCNLFYMYR